MRRLLTLCVLLCVGFAPAPLVRRDSAPPPLTHRTLAGTWEVRWGGGTYLMTFSPEGFFAERPVGWERDTYAGLWWLDKDELTVVWWYVYDDGSLGEVARRYKIKLTPDWHGFDREWGVPVAFVRKRKE